MGYRNTGLTPAALQLEDPINVLGNTASGYYYQLESEDLPGYRERCIALNERALALAEAGDELYAQCLSRLNLATNVALRWRAYSPRSSCVAPPRPPCTKHP